MNTHRAQIAGAALSATLALGGAVATEAGPADAVAPHATVCMTHHQFFDGLSTQTQRHTYRDGRYRWGVSRVRCAGRWAFAAVTAQKHGAASDTYGVLEHLSKRNNWYELSRETPCRRHDIPTALYRYACESS